MNRELAWVALGVALILAWLVVVFLHHPHL